LRAGDAASTRLRVNDRRIAVSRNGDPDLQHVPALSGENVGRVQQAKDEAKIEKIGKLRQFGLSDEQIAEVLGLTLE